MRLGAHRRNLGVWSASVGLGDTHGARRLTRTRRVRTCFRTGTLLTVVGLMRLARAVRPFWRPLLAGGMLTVVGVVLRSGAVVLPGLWLLVYAVLFPARPDADRRRHAELERGLTVYKGSPDAGRY
jgi:hypothetical protein